MPTYSTLHIYLGKDSKAVELEAKMRVAADRAGLTLNSWITSVLRAAVTKTVVNE
jgi:hypothetical protein